MDNLNWRKASASNPSGNCVEVAMTPEGEIAVRNSRFPDDPAHPPFTPGEWEAFVTGTKNGEFDLANLTV
jgi:hypothetical protein